MSVGAALWQHRALLVLRFQVAIIDGLTEAWHRCDPTGTGAKANAPQEPDLVAGLVLDSTPRIYSALESVLSPVGVSVYVGGVFCHQSPKVLPDGYGSGCELGDLLVVYVHRPAHAPWIGNAILLQAKVTSNQPYTVDSGGRVQLALYREWPRFTYTGPQPLTGQTRSVTPKSPHAGAQYLILDDRLPQDPRSGLLGLAGTYPAGCCMPDDFLFDHRSLQEELFALVTLSTGRPFEDRRSAMAGDNWSRVVWDLLESSLKYASKKPAVFTRTRSGRLRAPRATRETIDMMEGCSFALSSSGTPSRIVTDILGTNGAHLLSGDLGNEPPSHGDYNPEGEGSEGGISVLLIETSEAGAE
jgi:hypothetical protein